MTTPERQVLAGKLVAELHTIAEQIGVRDPKGLRKAQLIDAILNRVAEANGGGGAGAQAATQPGAPSDESGEGSGAERAASSVTGNEPNGGPASTPVVSQ
ncbi:MAG TPA: Rho termination factor N-terminal domain-containing protein, partial [Actinomycetota bacterium]